MNIEPTPTSLAERCARFAEQCRERGVRLTPQRMAVYRALAEDPDHPTADALHARLRRTLPTLSLATVYRVLESLEAEGFVRRVSTTDGVGRFDANLTAHQHLVCRDCGSIRDFTDEAAARLPLPDRASDDFVVEAVDVRYVGVCSACATARRRPDEEEARGPRPARAPEINRRRQ